MRKLLVLITTVILVLPAILYADSDDYFPLDQGMTWVYDDGNEDIISSFKLIGLPEAKTANLFIFKSYNHEERMFVRVQNKVYEWKDGYRRLVYDFDAKPGESWQLEWKAVNAEKEDPTQGNNDSDSGKPNDINEGATVTVVENDAAIETPMGKYQNTYHFRTSRPVMDASYVEEWFAPGVGCVARSWDTIAGQQQHRLVKVYGNEVTPVRYRMDVKLDKEIYSQGENIEIEVSVLNWSDEEIVLEFPTSLQVDYTIDDLYTWSEGRVFTQAITNVTIAARDVYKWTFTHTPEDYEIPAGKHIITASLVGTNLKASQGFLMTAERKALPKGLELTVATGKEIYAPGEAIDFTLTVNNPTENDITIEVYANNPVKYMIDKEIPYVELLLSYIPETVEVIIPTGQSVSYTGEHSATLFTLWPGDHVLYAGLYGYTNLASAKFTVSNELIYGALEGVIVTPSQNDTVTDTAYEPVEGAKVMLHAVLPANYRGELSFMSATDANLWSTSTDEEGAFLLDNVPVGSYYVLSVYKDDYYPYTETIRFLGENDPMQIILKPKKEHPDYPLTVNRWNVEGLIITFGTGSSVYQPDSEFKAYMSITNRREDTVTFDFGSENFVIWSILGSNGDLLWSSEAEVSTEKSSVEARITLEPGESREFYYEGSFDGLIPDTGGKYVIRGILDFETCSIASLEPESVSGSVKVLVVPSTSNRIEAHTASNELVLDAKEEVSASIDLTFKNNKGGQDDGDEDDGTTGEICMTEVRVNLHNQLSNHRFVKMVEIDADSTIRADMDSALVRIYYDSSDFEGDYDPEKLVIAHWRDNPKWDPSDIDPSEWDPSENPEWEILQTRIDTTNQCVEAYTKSFSSFGLFEYDENVTAVEEEEQIPESFTLMQNSPNPFNPVTFIQFSLPQTGTVEISVYNIMGQEVARLVDSVLPAGTHSVRFDGSALASGVYFYRVHSKGFNGSKKMLLLK